MDAALNIDVTLDGDEKITCFDVEVFRLNERQQANPQFDEIRASISQKGVQQPLHIVFHPEHQGWVLSQGGQTRLKICQELYEETSDERFLYPPFLKGEFTSDLELCINHLVENELRGDTAFVEKAKAILNIRELLADSRSGDKPTQEELSEQMANRGMPIRRQSITAMLYAAEILVPNITNQLFVASLSRKLVDSIRSIRKALEQQIGAHEFDQELISFINAFDENVQLKAIKEHFLPSKPAARIDGLQAKNRRIAEQLSSSLGLEGLVFPSPEAPSGFLVSIPFEVSSQKQAIFLYYLASLSGACDQVLSSEALDQMGLEGFDAGSDPSAIALEVQDRLGLSAIEIMSIPHQLFCEKGDDLFNPLMKLIAGVRESALKICEQTEEP